MIGRKLKEFKEIKKMDYPMLLVTIILISIGLIILASASSYAALNDQSDSNHFLFKQLQFALPGIFAMYIISRIDFRIYKKIAYLGYVIVASLMAIVLIPGIGSTVKGATRWLDIGITKFQPSELMKIVLIIVVATFISTNIKKIKGIMGYFIPALMLALVCLLMYFQNHLSGTVIMFVGFFAAIIASGLKINLKYVAIALVIIIIMGSVFVFSEDFRVKRITAFLNPEEDLQGDNWQAAQSLYSIGTGSLFGLGLGQSRQKFLWLPEAQNDFIFSILGEEFGFVGTVTVIGLFSFFIYRGYYIAIRCKDLYGKMIATGITSVFAVQIIINIAVVTCSMPVTGMPLPFFSYGGTALLINLSTMGILLNISRTNTIEKKTE